MLKKERILGELWQNNQGTILLTTSSIIPIPPDFTDSPILAPTLTKNFFSANPNYFRYPALVID